LVGDGLGGREGVGGRVKGEKGGGKASLCSGQGFAMAGQQGGDASGLGGEGVVGDCAAQGG
jgi:hypothetical protein